MFTWKMWAGIDGVGGNDNDDDDDNDDEDDDDDDGCVGGSGQQQHGKWALRAIKLKPIEWRHC